jgi:arabinogalactan endo-1,4-beta-galactosidase
VEMHRFAEENTVERLWNQDSSLWATEEHHIPWVKSNLRWLNLPEQIGSYLSKAIENARAVREDGLGHVVFVAMGAESREDLVIPGADYTFGELHLALAMAEAEARENSWKPTIWLHLANGAEKGLKELRDVVIQTLAQIQRNAG